PGVGTRFTVLLPASSGPLSSVGTTTPPPMTLLTNTPEISHPSPRRTRRSGTVPQASIHRTVPAPEPQRPKPEASTETRGLALVADDEPMVRQVSELMLRQMGFEVLTATNGEEAVSAFTANADRIRLVLLDLMMPVMDGTEALAAIRDRSAVPVIL